MEYIKEYVRVIVFYVVFTSLVEIIMPSDKYAKFIRIFLGLILMFLVMQPLFFIMGGDRNISLNVNMGYEEYIKENEKSIDSNYIEEQQSKLLLSGNIESKKREIEQIVENESEYKVVECEIEVEEGKDIKVKYIKLELKKEDDKKIKAIKKIVIEVDEKNVENGESLEIKKLLSEVYNLSVDNIYIYIQEEEMNG